MPVALWKQSPRLAFTRDVTRCEAKVVHFHFLVEGRAPRASHARNRSLELSASFCSQRELITKQVATADVTIPVADDNPQKWQTTTLRARAVRARLLRAGDRAAPGNRCLQTTLFRPPKTPPGPRTFAHTVRIDRKFNTRAQMMHWPAPARLRTHRASAFAVCAAGRMRRLSAWSRCCRERAAGSHPCRGANAPHACAFLASLLPRPAAG